MTNKIPVGATIARAYGFAIGNILNNLGAIWLPVAILYGLLIVFAKPYSAAVMTLASHDVQAILRLLPYILLGYAILFVLITAQIAALTKEALQLRTGSAWLQFPFGASAWRLMLAWLGLCLVVIMLYIGCIIGVAIFGAIAGFVAAQYPGAFSPVIMVIIVILLVIATLVILFYCIVRLSFLMAPVAVAEGKRPLQRSWELTRRNFWRSFIVLLAIWLPFIVIDFAYLTWSLGPDFIASGFAARSPDALALWRAQEQDLMLHTLQRSQEYWYIAYPIGLALALVLYGALTGASAFAYRALMPAEMPKAPPVPDVPPAPTPASETPPAAEPKPASPPAPEPPPDPDAPPPAV
jgi:hypothetical protein